jgi:hypothetical protein
MDLKTVEHAFRLMTTDASRRGALAALTGGLLAAHPFAREIDETEASKKSKRRKRRKNKKNKNRQNDPKVRVDAMCPTLGSVVSSITDGNVRFAQTFTALSSGPLVKAEILASKEPESEGDFVLRLSPVDASGVPTNEVLAEASVAPANVPDGTSTVTFTFRNPAPVVAGTEYALVLTRPGGTFVAWSGQFGNPCAGQHFLSADQEKPFQPTALGVDIDLDFTTFVRS